MRDGKGSFKKNTNNYRASTVKQSLEQTLTNPETGQPLIELDTHL